MNTIKKNPFEEELKAASLHNPYIDMELFREWQAVMEIIKNIPSAPEKPEIPKKQPLQPIPLRLFRR